MSRPLSVVIGYTLLVVGMIVTAYELAHGGFTPASRAPGFVLLFAGGITLLLFRRYR